MSESSPSSTPGAAPPADSEAAERQTMLFLDMVAQQTNLALIFLGEVPHPETGKRVRELNAARIFIDQLEMLEAKTRGNLNKHEEALLKQSLMTTRMAFVTAARDEQAAAAKSSAPAAPPPEKETSSASTSTAATPDSPAAAAAAPEAPPAAASQEDERKKFVKKY